MIAGFEEADSDLTGGGVKGLVNGARGKRPLRDGQWVGWGWEECGRMIRKLLALVREGKSEAGAFVLVRAIESQGSVATVSQGHWPWWSQEGGRRSEVGGLAWLGASGNMDDEAESAITRAREERMVLEKMETPMRRKAWFGIREGE
jgi:hypothetical protein